MAQARLNIFEIEEVLISIFRNIRGNEVKLFRLVNRTWNRAVLQVFGEKLTFNPERFTVLKDFRVDEWRKKIDIRLYRSLKILPYYKKEKEHVGMSQPKWDQMWSTLVTTGISMHVGSLNVNVDDYLEKFIDGHTLANALDQGGFQNLEELVLTFPENRNKFFTGITRSYNPVQIVKGSLTKLKRLSITTNSRHGADLLETLLAAAPNLLCLKTDIPLHIPELAKLTTLEFMRLPREEEMSEEIMNTFYEMVNSVKDSLISFSITNTNTKPFKVPVLENLKILKLLGAQLEEEDNLELRFPNLESLSLSRGSSYSKMLLGYLRSKPESLQFIDYGLVPQNFLDEDLILLLNELPSLKGFRMQLQISMSPQYSEKEGLISLINNMTVPILHYDIYGERKLSRLLELFESSEGVEQLHKKEEIIFDFAGYLDDVETNLGKWDEINLEQLEAALIMLGQYYKIVRLKNLEVSRTAYKMMIQCSRTTEVSFDICGCNVLRYSARERMMLSLRRPAVRVFLDPLIITWKIVTCPCRTCYWCCYICGECIETARHGVECGCQIPIPRR